MKNKTQCARVLFGGTMKKQFNTYDRRGIVVKYDGKEYAISGDTVMLTDDVSVTNVTLTDSDELYLLIETQGVAGIHQKVVTVK